MRVPFVNLELQYRSIKSDIDQAVSEVFKQGRFVGGEPVSRFEKEFAEKLKINHCIGTGNGTDSLFLILKALGIGPGDEVITPAFSCIASAEVISHTGARPVFADVNGADYTLNITDVQQKITPATKAIIAVHLYGQAALVSELKEVCNKHNLHLIEDCAQAHFTEENSTYVGTFGTAAAFSFYPTKNLGAYGDGGCVVTNSDTLAEKIRRLANHGAIIKDDHMLIGYNSRLDTLQASILSVKLRYIDSWNKRRISIANFFTEQLKASGITTPCTRSNTIHTFHIYAVLTPKRDALKDHLYKNGIETIIHYPKGLPFTDAYTNPQLAPTHFPVASKMQKEVLSLPLYPELTDNQVEYVVSSVLNYLNG